MLKRFNIDKVYPLSTPIVIRTLDVQKYPFCLPSEREIIPGPETLHLSVIIVLMYHTNNTRLEITFALNCLGRYNSTPM